jgi:hypothetical protein
VAALNFPSRPCPDHSSWSIVPAGATEKGQSYDGINSASSFTLCLWWVVFIKETAILKFHG